MHCLSGLVIQSVCYQCGCSLIYPKPDDFISVKTIYIIPACTQKYILRLKIISVSYTVIVNVCKYTSYNIQYVKINTNHSDLFFKSHYKYDRINTSHSDLLYTRGLTEVTVTYFITTVLTEVTVTYFILQD